MALSCPTETITSTNYTAKFNSIVISGSGSSTVYEKTCLPENGDGFKRSPNQFTTASGDDVIPATLQTHVSSLLTAWPATAVSVDNLGSRDPANPEGIINTKLERIQTFTEKSRDLRNSIKREYCFYYNRYMWGLTKILEDGTLNTLPTGYNLMVTNVTIINSKLNQILQILQAITNARTNSVNSYYSSDGLNTLNPQLDDLRDDLRDHSSKLKDKALQQNIQSAMIEYSLEKNRSSRNLLGIYGFMNIVAIGLLFYLYRSSKA